jgi:hypothetical protein
VWEFSNVRKFSAGNQRAEVKRSPSGRGSRVHILPCHLPRPSATRSPITSEGNELLVQFVSDLTVTADGFSASYKTLPRSTVEKEEAPSLREDTHKVRLLAMPKLQPNQKPEVSPEAKATPVGTGESGEGEEGGINCKGNCFKKFISLFTHSFIQSTLTGASFLLLASTGCLEPKLNEALKVF